MPRVAFAERQTVIEVPRERVWELLAGINDWPRWQSGVSKARLEGPLRVGTEFRWKAGGMSITSEVEAVIAPSHIAWKGETLGSCALHRWDLYPHPRGTLVVTAESFEGQLARLLRPVVQRKLDRSLTDGLTELKREVGKTSAEVEISDGRAR